MTQYGDSGNLCTAPLPEQPALSPGETCQKACLLLSVSLPQATTNPIPEDGFLQDFLRHSESNLKTG